MLPLPQIGPSEDLLTQLAAWQNQVDTQPDYPKRVAQAESDWKRKRACQPMRDIETLLEQMLCGGRCCAYCENSLAHQIDHIWPVTLYPQQVFEWLNYLYACGSCNQKKGASFAVYPAATGPLQCVSGKRGAPVTEPPYGEMVFIDPRCEDPRDFFTMDLRGSFRICIQSGLTGRARERAKYTLEQLPLNSDPLRKQRRNAYRHYVSELQHYIRGCEHNKTARQLRKHRLALADFAHQTVWFEMKRQQAKIPELAALFARAPESLGW